MTIENQTEEIAFLALQLMAAKNRAFSKRKYPIAKLEKKLTSFFAV